MSRLVYNHDAGAMEVVSTPYGSFTPGAPKECHPRVYEALKDAVGFSDPDLVLGTVETRPDNAEPGVCLDSFPDQPGSTPILPPSLESAPGSADVPAAQTNAVAGTHSGEFGASVPIVAVAVSSDDPTPPTD